MLDYLVPKSNEIALKTINGVSIKGLGNINTDSYMNNASYIRLGAGYASVNDVGESNVAIGYNSFLTNTVGSRNVAIGAGSLYSNTTGSDNCGIGQSSLGSNTIGTNNVAIGGASLMFNISGTYNVAVGDSALFFNTESNFNTAIGAWSLFNATYSNCSGLGNSSSVTASNQIQLGNSATTTYVYGTVQNRSDLRDKADVRDTLLGLDFINKLRPVDYKWDMREYYKENYPIKKDNQTEEDYKIIINEYIENNKLSNITHNGTKKGNRYHHGLIAQEVKQVLVENNIDFGGYQDHSTNGGDDVLSIGYDELIAPLIKSIQELTKEIKLLKEKTINL